MTEIQSDIEFFGGSVLVCIFIIELFNLPVAIKYLSHGERLLFWLFEIFYALLPLVRAASGDAVWNDGRIQERRGQRLGQRQRRAQNVTATLAQPKINNVRYTKLQVHSDSEEEEDSPRPQELLQYD